MPIVDAQYKHYDFENQEVEHEYGKQVHILKDPTLLTLLAKISAEKTTQPLLSLFIKKAYLGLFNYMSNALFQKSYQEVDTRMKSIHPEGVIKANLLDQKSKFVVVDLARAGIMPSEIIYNELNFLYKPQNVRQDHFYVARKVNSNNEVIGIDISGSKIGGDIEDSYVIFPDPMGATGGTICESISHYKKEVKGNAKKIIAVHLIITPEYIKRVTEAHPDVEVYAIRLDRGLSSEKALSHLPGKFFSEEKGLNKNQYIVPGAGGIGELLNNAFV